MSAFHGLLDALFIGLHGYAEQSQDGALKQCNSCTKSAVPFQCFRCGEYACLDHIWANKGLICLCDQCMGELLLHDQYQRDDPRERRGKRRGTRAARPSQGTNDFAEYARDFTASSQPHRPRKQAPREPAAHWAILGLAPGATVDDINRAFRLKSQSCHPDKAGSNEVLKRKLHKQFIKLNDARQAALEETQQ